MSKTILITGSSSGIGKATAKFFHEKGWNVVATMRSPEKETELTGLENVLVTRLDVQDQATVKQAVQAGIETFGRIDVLVNNAGYGAFGPLEAFSKEKIARQFDVNVLGLLDVTKEILPHFRKNKSGVLVNISSIGGKMTFPLGSLYHGTKFAVEGISEALSFELEPAGIKVKIVEPGAIKTDFTGRSFDFMNDESIEEYQPVVGKVMNGFQQAMDNAAEPIVVAEVIYQAATDNSNTLRYTAGDDAVDIMANRQKLNDKDFIDSMKAMFAL